MVKRSIQSIFMILAFLILFFIYFNFFGGSICNDIKASQIEKGFYKLELPAGAELVEVSSFVGNTSGTGNHTEIWAGMLIRSGLAEEDIRGYFRDYDVWVVPGDLTAHEPYAEGFISFTALAGKASGAGYYVVSGYYDAFTQMDLRGH